ncbi:MAG: hypothetical protein AB7P04_09380 [Bacteriovoracia bacterium]
MAPETPGQTTRTVDVNVFDSSMNGTPGVATVQEWNSTQAFVRGFKRSARIVIMIFVIMLPLAVIEPFLFMIWGSAISALLIFIVGPFLHMKYWSERATFLHVESSCPYCKVEGRLTPFLSTAFVREGFTALCPACGQTVRVVGR